MPVMVDCLPTQPFTSDYISRTQPSGTCRNQSQELSINGKQKPDFIDEQHLHQKIEKSHELSKPCSPSPTSGPKEGPGAVFDVSEDVVDVGASDGPKNMYQKFDEMVDSHADRIVLQTLCIIDLRNMFKFTQSHVRDSINVSNNPLLQRRVKDGKLQIKEYLESRVRLDGDCDIVIYDDDTTSDNPLHGFVQVIYENLVKIKSTTMRLQVLEGGFDSFKAKYPQHCTNGVPFIPRHFGFVQPQNDEMAFLNWEATEIAPKLYLGALHDADDEPLLDRLGITHVLNCCQTQSNVQMEHCNKVGGGKYVYLNLKCADDLRQSLDAKLDEAVSFIKDTINDDKHDNKVLVHCYAGISRSAAIVIAYLMIMSGQGYDSCYKQVKDKRKIVAPNINFVSQLMKLEDKLNNEKPSSNGAIESKPEATVILTTTTTTLSSAPLNNIIAKRKKFSGNLGMLKVSSRGVRHADICSAPIIPSAVNPFAAQFKQALEAIDKHDDAQSAPPIYEITAELISAESCKVEAERKSNSLPSFKRELSAINEFD
jgi:protein-tyrosine phosphatase